MKPEPVTAREAVEALEAVLEVLDSIGKELSWSSTGRVARAKQLVKKAKIVGRQGDKRRDPA